MAHKFDVNSRNKLDNPKRRELLPADRILREIGLQAGDRFADIGCGTGYFSLPAAKLVGNEGLVYALDITEEMLADLRDKINENNSIDGNSTEGSCIENKNINTILTGEYDFKLEDKAVNIAFICTVLHEVDDKTAFINEAKRVLQPGGKIAIVEWVKRESDWGPPMEHRLDAADVRKTLSECGFTELLRIDINEHYYMLIGAKV